MEPPTLAASKKKIRQLFIGEETDCSMTSLAMDKKVAEDYGEVVIAVTQLYRGLKMFKLSGNRDSGEPGPVYWAGLRHKSPEERSLEAETLAICPTTEEAEKAILPVLREVNPLPAVIGV